MTRRNGDGHDRRESRGGSGWKRLRREALPSTEGRATHDDDRSMLTRCTAPVVLLDSLRAIDRRLGEGGRGRITGGAGERKEPRRTAVDGEG